MVEYITKSDAVFAACKVLNAFGGCHMGPFCPDSGCKEVREVFKNVPAADVVEVRHGRWINERQEGLSSFSAECNLCGKRTLAYFHYFYCPNCGAKMDGG